MNIIFFCLSVCIVLVVSLFSAISYPTIHSIFFSRLPESEVQQYFIGIGMVLIGFSLLYWVRPKARISLHPGIVISILLALIIVVSMGFERLIGSEQFRQQLLVMGIRTADRLDIGLFFLISSGYFLFFVLSELRTIRMFFFVKHIVVVGLIVVLAFQVGYLSMYNQAIYAGAIFDTIHGKSPLTFYSNYGFLSIVTLATAFGFIPLSLLNLTIVTSIAVIIGFIFVYYLCLLIYRKFSLATLAIIMIIIANWIVVGSMRNTSPQSTVLRFGMWIPVALLIHLEHAAKSARSQRVVRYFVELAVAGSLFWTFDIGVYIVIAYLLFRWFLSLGTSPVLTARAFLSHIVILALVALGIFVGVHLFYILILNSTPQWQYLVGGPLLYTSYSFFLLPVPQTFLPWIVLAPAVLAIIYLLAKKIEKPELPARDVTLLFIACFGMTQFAYFMGRSSLGNLSAVSIPLTFCFFALIGIAAQFARSQIPALKLSMFCGMSFLLTYPTYFLLPQAIGNVRQENIYTSLQTVAHPQGTEQEMFGESVQLIKARYGDYITEQGIALLTVYDTWFMILLDRPNEIGSNCLSCAAIPQLVQPYIETVKRRAFRYLFVDRGKNLEFGQVSWIFREVESEYRFKENLGGWLDVYEHK